MIRARCEVLSARKAGLFISVTLVAPEIAERARPGQFILIAAPPGREVFLRRPFFVHQTSRRGGWAGTLEFVFDAHMMYFYLISNFATPAALTVKPVWCVSSLLVCPFVSCWPWEAVPSLVSEDGLYVPVLLASMLPYLPCPDSRVLLVLLWACERRI